MSAGLICTNLFSCLPEFTLHTPASSPPPHKDLPHPFLQYLVPPYKPVFITPSRMDPGGGECLVNVIDGRATGHYIGA